MTYPETIDYLYSQLPMFTRDGASAFKKDLTNTLELCKRLGQPQHLFKSVHIGGTNGKGSTSHMLAAILQTAGYKTGLYTSPHLKDFRERIRVNGQMISEETVIDFVEEHQQDFEEIKPSFFEMTVALAFDTFAKEQVDIAIIEVGLGGRLDSTNVITPLLSVITNIGWDHMNMLGNTLQLIAAEKAGIIKPNIPVIIGEYQPEVADIFISKAAAEHAFISFASSLLSTESQGQSRKSDIDDLASNDLLNVTVYPAAEGTMISDMQKDAAYAQLQTSDLRLPAQNLRLNTLDLKLDLTGTYQLKNVKTVLLAVAELRRQGFFIRDEHIKTALSQVKKLTGLHGRWETLNTNPLTICDTGHNPDGMAEVLKNIEALPYQYLHFIIGMVNDKDISKILAMLPADATYYFCKPNIPRGLDAELLKQKATDLQLKGETFASVKQALKAAQHKAGPNDLVFVGGSTFVVAEVI
jgi:dihydrofolate synthase/folylpolyglutamate synthase